MAQVSTVPPPEGFGATMRLLARRGREGTTKARLGPFSLVDRD